MVKKSLRKNLFREIKSSFGRFVAILAIVALGVGLFAGLKVTTKAMLKTGDEYFRDNNLFDFRLISTLGLYEEDIDELKKLDFIKSIEGSISTDTIIERDENSSFAVRLMAMPVNINGIILREGRLPEKDNECLMDVNMFSTDMIGKTIKISSTNSEDMLDMMSETEYTIVGLCQSVLYANFERGNTSLGNGKISGFMYVLPAAFSCDYFTEIYAVTDAAKFKIYSDKYDDLIDEYSDKLEPVLDKLALDRYTDLKTDAEKEIADAEEKLGEAKAEIIENEKKIADGKIKIANSKVDIKDAKKEIEKHKQEIEDGKKEIEKSKKEISDGYKSIKEAKEQLELMKLFMPGFMYQSKLSEIEANEAVLKAGEAKIADAEKDIKNGEEEIADAEEKIKDGEKDIAKAEADIKDAEEKIADGKAEIAEHEEELNDGKEELSKLKEPDTYVLTRSTNIGYACFENDASIVEGIGNVFPVFFFLVAALVCMTTMSRMVEEKRVEIGTMKSLGYGEASIMGKYLFYSGSAAMVGCVAGFYAGSYVFPYVIWIAYGIMYTMKDIVFVFDGSLAIISVVVSVLCSMGATYVTLRKELSANAADLIRPKAPKNGKRVFLEYIKPLWNHMSFTSKVSARNIFRYQKRFWMMILGVGGCYGLLITGFGIKDSIADVCDRQFNDIQKYGITVTFKDDVEDRDYFTKACDGKAEYMYTGVKTVDVVFDNAQKSANMVIISDIEDKNASDFINFLDDKGNTLSLPGTGEAIISSKMARLLSISVGDEVILRDPDLEEVRVKVSGIMRNYVYNWAYISAETYRSQKDKEPDINTAFVRTVSTGDYEFGVELRNLDDVSSVSVADEMSIRINSMMDSLNQIVYLVILCAAMLAFIVMYNLTNINITERMREIATLKVLGFYPFETAIYVFRENLVLTLFGMIAGVFLGNGLHRYVMYNITVEVVSFDTKILPISYLYAVLFTLLFAFIVDIVLDIKIEKIKMAESLKSVE